MQNRTHRLLPAVAAALLALPLAPAPLRADYHPDWPNVRADVPIRLITIARDDRIRLTLHQPVVVMGQGGWQPFLFCSSQGTLFCQSFLDPMFFQAKGQAIPQNRMGNPMWIGTAISRDAGATWAPWTQPADRGHSFYIEGGGVERRHGAILLFDTFVVPSDQPDHGVGELWKSRDDLHTLEGPFRADFYLPQVKWTVSTGDGGRPHPAVRLHRSILEMPDGDLLATLYGWFDDDRAPCPYMPSMKKARTVIVRSRDRGARWSYLATVAVDGAVGTEGFVEPVMARISRGPHAGRLLCLMRTGRDLYGSHSDDRGATWSRAQPVLFPGIDIYDTARWVRLFADPDAPGYVPSDQMLGAVVDPDLIELHDGTLVCAVGVRTPEKKCFENWRSPVNGDYLAFSFDGGDSWTEVVQFLSGQPTTQYIGIREIKPGVLYVTYDDSNFRPAGRTMGFQLEARRKN